MEDLFPFKEGMSYSLLKTTEEGSYSITRRRDANRVMTWLENTIGNLETKTITDSTACNGGDTINFALKFKSVKSIELQDINFEILKHNVEQYGLTNVELFHGDCTKIMNWKSDLLYIDPPWGGPNYKLHENLDLFLGAKRLDIWIEEILQKYNHPCYIVLKVPQNYNFARLFFFSKI
jgi:predicted RNA methylase